MRETPVILSTTTPAATRDPFLGPLPETTSTESLAAGVSVEVEDIDAHEMSSPWFDLRNRSRFWKN
jgi:hypothetical protein